MPPPCTLPLLVLAREDEIFGLQFFRLILYFCKGHVFDYLLDGRFMVSLFRHISLVNRHGFIKPLFAFQGKRAIHLISDPACLRYPIGM